MKVLLPIGHRIALGSIGRSRRCRRGGIISLVHRRFRHRAGRTDHLVHPGTTGQRIEITGSLDLARPTPRRVVLLPQQILLGLSLGLLLLGGGGTPLVHP